MCQGRRFRVTGRVRTPPLNFERLQPASGLGAVLVGSGLEWFQMASANCPPECPPVALRTCVQHFGEVVAQQD